MSTTSRDPRDDRTLLRAGAAGDEQAFAVLFERHFAATFHYALSMLDGDDALAQDVAQATWIRVWQHAASFRGDAQVRTWIFTILTRQVADDRRRRRPVAVADEELQRAHDALRRRDPGAHAAPAAEDDAATAQLWAAVAVALAELPWRQRETFVLREFEGLGYAEIATVLGTSVTVVRGQLHRARRALAYRLRAWRPDGSFAESLAGTSAPELDDDEDGRESP